MIKCEICGKDFKNVNSLRSHKSQKHKQENKTVNKPVNVNLNEPDKQDIPINDKDVNPDKSINVNTVNPDDITINKADFSSADLDLQKKKLAEEEQNILENDEEVRTVNELIINFDEKDGAELYGMLIELVGDLSGVDVEKDIPNWTDKVSKRGKRLSFIINKYAEQYKQYIIPLMFVVGLGSDVLLIRKLGKIKKEINKVNAGKVNVKVNEIKEINEPVNNINGVTK